MKLLNAVNLIMPKLGERPVTTLDSRHPTLAVLLPVVEQIRKETLNRGWWFNEYDYRALPDVAGEITLGSETLSFVPDRRNTAVLRGLQLFNPVTLSYVFTEAVPGRVTQDVVFDELPESAATYIFYSAAIDAYATDIGVSQELSVWQQKAAQAWSDLIAEHLRQKKHSTRNSPKWRRLRAAMKG